MIDSPRIAPRRTAHRLRRRSRIAAGLAFGMLALAAHAQPAPGTALGVGAAMEDFGLRALDIVSGKLAATVWLSDFVGVSPTQRPRKQLLLLNFFAVWCKPCVAELPALARLHARYAGRGLQLLSVNFRAQSEPVEQALAATQRLWQERALGFPVLFDRFTNRNQLLYMGSQASLPCNILIERDGRIAARFQGGDDKELALLEQQVARLLGDRAGGEP